MAAVSALARKYPMGLPASMAGPYLERKPEEAGSVRDYFGLEVQQTPVLPVNGAADGMAVLEA